MFDSFALTRGAPGKPAVRSARWWPSSPPARWSPPASLSPPPPVPSRPTGPAPTTGTSTRSGPTARAPSPWTWAPAASTRTQWSNTGNFVAGKGWQHRRAQDRQLLRQLQPVRQRLPDALRVDHEPARRVLHRRQLGHLPAHRHLHGHREQRRRHVRHLPHPARQQALHRGRQLDVLPVLERAAVEEDRRHHHLRQPLRRVGVQGHEPRQPQLHDHGDRGLPELRQLEHHRERGLQQRRRRQTTTPPPTTAAAATPAAAPSPPPAPTSGPTGST